MSLTKNQRNWLKIAASNDYLVIQLPPSASGFGDDKEFADLWLIKSALDFIGADEAKRRGHFKITEAGLALWQG